jgi:alpha-tubulin suppressor-like RCC1 family protein
MPYQPTTNFVDSNGIDLGKKLVTKDYLLSVYAEVVESSSETGLSVSPGLWTWGRNYRGSLGINSGVSDARSTPVTTFLGGTNWKQVSFGQECGAAIKTDGTLWTWGDNTYGQLGTNDTTQRNTPVPTFVGGTNWKQVVCSRFHISAIKTDGTLWTWGRNSSGQLGTNDTTQRNTPVTTFLGGTNWKSIFDGLGFAHSSAIKTDGTLWTWGGNSYGQLGHNDTIQRNTPTQLGIETTWKQVSCGTEHTIAIKSDGTLWTWGRNSYGQLGINLTGNTNGRTTPVTTFIGGTNWKNVSGGWYHTSAIKTDGTLWLWGRNDSSQLGTNDATQRNTPVTTFFGTTDWNKVSSGTEYTSAIKVDGSLWNWGRNDFRQLGINNTDTSKITPVTTFAGGNNWKQVSTGFRHTGAIRSVNEI